MLDAPGGVADTSKFGMGFTPPSGPFPRHSPGMGPGQAGNSSSTSGILGAASSFIPSAGRYVNTAQSLLSLFGGGSSGSLILRGSGGLLPGAFTPIPAFAAGGIAGGPTFGLIGEAGPEAVVPLRSGKIPVHVRVLPAGPEHPVARAENAPRRRPPAVRRRAARAS